MDKEKILVAMDSYKGCLSQDESNAAAAAGAKAACPEAEIETACLSDGGEGWTDAFAHEWGGEKVETLAHDALMRPIRVHYLVKGDTAVVEVAQAVGLSMIEPDQRNPLRATSYGVGEMIADAIGRGCRRFLVGLGGSATSDAGIGMLQALTKRLARGGNFADIEDLDGLKFVIGSDVVNPLTGPQGAAAVFGPQKGATPDMIPLLDRRAATMARMAASHFGYDMSQKPGAGAAGGLGYAFMQFLHAERRSGAELMLSETGFDDKLDGCSLVMTGEGSSDVQTLMGKLPSVVLAHAMRRGVPVALLSGRISERGQLLSAGFARVVEVSEGLDDATAMQPAVAKENITRAAQNSTSTRKLTCRPVK